MKSLLRFALILASGVMPSFLLSAQTPPGDAGSGVAVGPIIQFNTEAYDFGKVLSGETVNYTFIVTNAGDATLDILGVKPGCSCTVVDKSWTEHIAPHQTGIIPVSVHTSGRGPIDKAVTVTSNDSNKNRAAVSLHVRGLVWIPIDVLPQTRVNFTVKPDTRPVPQVLTIINRTGEPLDLSAPHSTSPLFSAVLVTNKPGEEFALQVTMTPPVPATNPRVASLQQGNITLQTSCSNMPVLTIPAIATIQPEIQFLPAQITVQPGQLGAGCTNYISVLNNTTRPLHLLEASAGLPGVSAVIRTVTTNQNYTVAVGIPPGLELKPNVRTVVSIKTDNPRYPTIEVPVLLAPPVQRRVLPPPAPAAMPAKS